MSFWKQVLVDALGFVLVMTICTGVLYLTAILVDSLYKLS